MPAIFESKPGMVVMIPDGDVKGLVTLGGWGDIQATKSIITDLTIERGENYQEQHSLADLVYMMAFGERIGPLGITGVSFASVCGDAPEDETGMEKVNRYYNDNRIGNPANTAPITILLGSGSDAGMFLGLLVGCRINVSRPEMRMADFNLAFRSLPGGA